jgi:hypothetical protein
MKEEDKVKFAEAMRDMAISAGVSITKEIMRVYWDKLKDYKVEFVLRGIDAAARKNTYHVLPVVGQIIKNIEK